MGDQPYHQHRDRHHQRQLSNPDVLGVAVSDTGSDVYVLSNAITGADPYGNSLTAATVEVIDPATNAVINTIALPGLDPYSVAISNAGPEAGDLYISSADITGATQFTRCPLLTRCR